MVFRFLKKTIIFSVAAILCYGLFVSCENPFRSDLGSKVDIVAPTIKVSSPEPGDLLRDVVTFSGEVTAYRDLRRSNGEYSDAIQVMIYDQKDDSKIYLDWTTIGRSIESIRDKTWKWTYDLDTKNFSDTGFLKIQFRVYDESADPNRKPTETIPLVYIVKNKPSSIKLSSPEQSYLDSAANELAPFSLITGDEEIRGSVLDRRGLKPGYPMIKIWPKDIPEPAGDDTDWGWASLFLDEKLDDPKSSTGGLYTNRNNEQVVYAASFTFKLWKFFIDRETRRIMYDRRGGEPIPLDSKEYRFRIKTSDTYSNIADSKPRPPEGDERETIGYYPGNRETPDNPPIAVLSGEEGQWDNSGPSYLIQLKEAGVNPTIQINNFDVDTELVKTPHIYLTPDSMKKIAVRKPPRADFRLQILAQHPSGIEKATLQYEYMDGLSFKEGSLPWDNTGTIPGYTSKGYVDGANEAEGGHKGWEQTGNELEGTFFRYTDTGNEIFTKSTEFKLIVTAYATGGNSNTIQEYIMYLDNTCPEVNLIRPVRGAANDPTDSAVPITDNTLLDPKVIGFYFNEAYTVNGNIQVSVNRTGRGIQSTKWIVEDNKTGYLDAADTLLAKLKAYREEPNSTNFDFYKGIAEGHYSGMVNPPAETGLDPDKTWNFKLNTTAKNGQELWLYVIAQDELQNLGFVMQKLKVDNDSDKPVLTTGDNFLSTTTTLADASKVTSLDDLYYKYNGTTTSGNVNRKNRLEDGGIELTFTDDDGISLAAGNITITLTDLNVTPNVTQSLTIPQIQSFLNGPRYLIDGNSGQWNGVLEQSLMAAVLYAGQNPLPTKLHDGFYRLNVTLNDNLAAKVNIDRTGTGVPSLTGDTATVASASPQEFFFAVQNKGPVLTIESPESNQLLNSADSSNLTISGKVTSGVKIQRLEITFTPDVAITSADLTLVTGSNPRRYSVNTLYSNAGFTNVVPTFGDFARTANQYVYYWRIRTVNLSATNSTSPSFRINAYDGLGYQENDRCEVEIDNEPPTVSLDLFNFGRDDFDKVNGKVPIEIGVYDLGGIRVNDNGTVQVKWWVVPSTITPATYFAQGFNTAAITTGPNGASGQLRAGVAPGGDELGAGTGKYLTYFDTTNFSELAYHLYAMAQDGAGNFSQGFAPNRPTRLGLSSDVPLEFTINKASDLPVLVTDTLFPDYNANMSNKDNDVDISGDVKDDDGFDRLKANTYVYIRFPTSVTPERGKPGDPGFALTWGNIDNGWKPVPAELVDNVLKFKFVTKGDPYFTNPDNSTFEGYKFYQIRIYDEAVAGAVVAGSPYRNPPGKNPDGVTTGPTAIQTATTYYPGGATPNGFHYFLLKNGAPQVYFKKYDPNSSHPGYDQSASRPAYSNLEALLTDLAGVTSLTGVTNLNGGIEIQEATTVDKVELVYENTKGNGIASIWNVTADLGTPVGGSDRFPLNTLIATLRTRLTWNGTARTGIPFGQGEQYEGPDSILIRAYDPVGNQNDVYWDFNIDNVGPNITFNNVTDNAGTNPATNDLPIVAGRAGRTTYIRGRFQDDYSDIGNTYRYSFNNTADASWTTNTFLGQNPNGKKDGRSAEWEIVVPSTLLDGVNTLYIEARDMGNNLSAAKYRSAASNGGIKFILDAKAPAVSEPEDMLVKVGTANPVKLSDAERIFSAAYTSGTGTIFTLSGMAYDMYLSGVTVNYPTEVKVEGIGTNQNLRLRAATENDLNPTANPPGLYTRIDNDGSGTGITNLYVWELDIRRTDIVAILGGDTETATNTSKLSQITVTAQDRAEHNSVKKDWSFYLDGEKPTVSFINAHKGTGTPEVYRYYNGSTDSAWITGNPPLPARMDILNNDFTLEGQAKDGTGVKEIRYILSRSDNGSGADTDWRYYTGGGNGTWSSETRPTAFNLETAWPLLYNGGNNLERTADWKLNNAKLAEARLNAAVYYPANLSDGLYRMEMWVYDYSKAGTSAGNPNNFSVQFFIDRNEPDLTWTKSQDFYRLGNMEFIVTAKDANGIVSFAEAHLRKYGSSTNIDTPTASPLTITSLVTRVSATETTPEHWTIKVNITEVTAGTLDDGRYTLVMTIKDRTGKDAIIGNTVDFYLDNKKPTISLAPSGATEAIVGRAMFQGSFGKPTSSTPTSSIARVAFQLAKFTGAVPSPVGNSDTVGGVLVPQVGNLTDADLKTNGWYFDNGGAVNTNPTFTTGTAPNTQILAQMYPGTSNANILVSSTRNFTSAVGGNNYLGTAQAAGGAFTFGTFIEKDAVTEKDVEKPFVIPNTAGHEIQQLRLYVLAIDEAGNHTITPVDYWVYPEGDKPKVDKVSNPNEADTTGVNNLFSGNFRIGGSAVDNTYVRNVFFRVYVGTIASGVITYSTTPKVLDNIPEWNSSGEAISGSYQGSGKTVIATANSGTNTGGWYKANGGGSRSVSWWAMINNNGELDPDGQNGRVDFTPIKIEVLAEDSIWNDFRGTSGAWEIEASDKGLYSNVKTVLARVVSGAPTYANEIVRQGASGANSNTPPTGFDNWTAYFDTWSSALTTNVSGRASYAITVQGVSAIGEIRWTRPTGAIVNLLDPNNAYNTLTGTVSGTYAGDLSAMGTTTAGTGPGIAVRAIKISDTEYRVVVDINSFILGGTPYPYGTDKAGFYEMTIEAADKSSPAPLRSQTTVSIPIDNIPPEALYNYSTRVAGSSATFGGLAGDAGNPSGLDRVVIWFSRKVVEGANIVDRSVPWAEINPNSTPPGESLGNTFVAGTPPANMVGTILAGVYFPQIPAENGTGNYNCIVIDRNDPMGNTAHHGHTVPMGFAKSGAGTLDMSWYAVLNSLQMTSGAQTIHYVVYDKAGNTRYYNQKIMVMNGIPKIEKITLGTDIRGNMGFGAPLTANTAIPSTGTSALTTISNRFTALGLNPVNTTTAQGISEEIAIDTSRPNTYGVVYDQEFSVRNNLLAINIETNDHTSGKPRYYRFEYVSNARLIRGTGGINAAGQAVTTETNQIRHPISGIRAGRVYIINDPGSETNRFPWGALGAQGETFGKGLAFLALEDGATMNLPALPGTNPYGTPSVWELNSSYYANSANNDRTVPTALAFTGGTGGDVNYAVPNGTASRSAEFVYGGAGAFNATGNYAVTGNINTVAGGTISSGGQIVDFVPDLNTDGRPLGYLATSAGSGSTAKHPLQAHSLFIVRVFDKATADPDELFGDFALLSIRVNNNDKTLPYSQLYDLNPKTEGQEMRVTDWATALSPGGMGSNRTKGGLYNTEGNTQSVVKSGHIEPRTATSLTSLQMGGADTGAGSLSRPEANANAYFTVDTVSGEVIVRGYAEDDQRIGSVALQFYNEANNGTALSTVTILNYASRNNGPANSLIGPPTAEAANVSFTETMDLYKHRVEWAYRWNTETRPGGNYVVGNYTVRAVVQNVNNNNFTLKDNSEPILRSSLNANNRNTYDYFNPTFPSTTSTASSGNFYRYNVIRVNIRPYITGFKRNQSTFSHDTRSRQGRYMFARNELAVVTGFNLVNGDGTGTTISLGTTDAGAANPTVTTTTVGTPGNFGITGANTTSRYQQFTVSNAATQTTGNGTVRLTVNGQQAVNTSSDRPAGPVIQPWNVEYNPGKAGSDLWDDFTAVHIWQSDGNTNNTDNGQFRSTNNNWVIMNPAMSIDPSNGTLYASHNEGGSGNAANTGTTRWSSNAASGNVTLSPTTPTSDNAAQPVNVLQFVDPIIQSDIYRSPGSGNQGAATWVASSIIGRSSTLQLWANLGGIYIHGPNGSSGALLSGSYETNTSGVPGNANAAGYKNLSLYLAESTWYNASSNSVTVANPSTTDQFLNPHVITSYSGPAANTLEHIHVSYYDSKDGSIKYRYNQRNNAGTIYGGNANDATPYNVPRTWVNLDGGFDTEDATTGGTRQTVAIATNANRYLRQVLVADGALVTQNQQIYQFGTNAAGAGAQLTYVTAPVAGYVSLVYTTAATNAAGQYTNQVANNAVVFTVFPASTDRVFNYTGRRSAATGTGALVNGSGAINAGEHNAIATTSGGFPVIAYYDATNQKLKLAVSNKVNPLAANDWVIRDNVIPTGNLSHRGTGQFVSIAIDQRVTPNIIHIAAMNTNGNLVYVKGSLNPGFTNGNRTETTGGVLTRPTGAPTTHPEGEPVVQVVDSNGTVGRWCNISLDNGGGNPWIAYQDTGYIGAKDGVKLAYLNTTTFTKGRTTFAGEDMDVYGESITGWETMHVPTVYRVENPNFGMGEHGRIGLECFPTRNVAAGNGVTKTWSAAVSYLSTDLYRIAYYVK